MIRNKIIYHIIRECSIFAQKEWNTRYGESDPLEIVQEILIWSYEQVVYAQPGIRSGELDTLSSLGVEVQADQLISARRPDLWYWKKKKEKITCQIVDLAVPADHRVKLKEDERGISK